MTIMPSALSQRIFISIIQQNSIVKEISYTSPRPRGMNWLQSMFWSIELVASFPFWYRFLVNTSCLLIEDSDRRGRLCLVIYFYSYPREVLVSWKYTVNKVSSMLMLSFLFTLLQCYCILIENKKFQFTTADFSGHFGCSSWRSLHQKGDASFSIRGKVTRP